MAENDIAALGSFDESTDRECSIFSVYANENGMKVDNVFGDWEFWRTISFATVRQFGVHLKDKYEHMLCIRDALYAELFIFNHEISQEKPDIAVPGIATYPIIVE